MSVGVSSVEHAWIRESGCDVARPHCPTWDGRSLRDWISCNAKPSVSDVVEIVEQIITGLRAMHRKETLHGDLKPDNVMIDADGTVRIIDFGSCHVAGVREIDLPFARGFASILVNSSVEGVSWMSLAPFARSNVLLQTGISSISVLRKNRFP